MIAIIGAMEQELNSIIFSLVDKKEFTYQNKVFYQGFIDNKEVVVVKSGIGKVDAGVATSLLLDHFNIDLLINVGLCGGNGEFVNKGELVLIDKIANHDVDCSCNNDYVYGQLPTYPLVYNTDKETNDSLLKDNSLKVVSCLTGDCFISNQYYIKERLDYFSSIENFIPGVFDMEGAAIAQVCYNNKVKLVMLKSVSDIINSKNQFDDYFAKKYSCADLLLEVIRNYLPR